MQKLSQQQKIAALHRQLIDELALLSFLGEINDQTTELISTDDKDSQIDATIHQTLELLVQQFESRANQTRGRRKAVLKQLNSGDDSGQELTVRQFIDRCPEPSKEALSKVRMQVINKLQEIKSTIAANQAIVYYSFEFYRRLLNSVMKSEPGEPNYGPDGNKSQPLKGELFGKAV